LSSTVWLDILGEVSLRGEYFSLNLLGRLTFPGLMLRFSSSSRDDSLLY
jgi:hypothetical protein